MLFGTYMQVVKEDGVWKSNGIFRRSVMMMLTITALMLRSTLTLIYPAGSPTVTCGQTSSTLCSTSLTAVPCLTFGCSVPSWQRSCGRTTPASFPHWRVVCWCSCWRITGPLCDSTAYSTVPGLHLEALVSASLNKLSSTREISSEYSSDDVMFIYKTFHKKINTI